MGKRKSTSSLCHLGSHSTWCLLGPLLPHASPALGPSGYVISLSSGLPQHLVPVRTSLTTCVSPTGAVWLRLSSLSSGLPQHLVPVRTSLTTCVSRTGASGYIYPHHSLSKGPGYVLLTSSQNRTWACRMAGAHLFLNAWINQSM